MPKKILVRVPQWLGDAVVSTVFLTRLKEKFPDILLDVLCPSYLSDIFSTHPSVHHVNTLPYASGGTVFRVPRQLKPQSYDRAYILPRSFRAALEMTLSGIPERIGYAGDVRRFMLTQVFPYDPTLLYPLRYLKLIGEEGTSIDSLTPYFPQAKMSMEDFSARFSLDGANLKKPFWALAPVSVAPARTWDGAKFVDAANSILQRKGGTILLFGSKKESPQIAELHRQIKGPCLDLSGKLNWAELGWALSQCAGFLGNDSGLMHVAGVFKIPSVVLFGPSNPAQALPVWGRFTPLQNKDVPCVPCYRNECVRFGSHYKECLATLSAQTAVDSLLSMV